MALLIYKQLWTLDEVGLYDADAQLYYDLYHAETWTFEKTPAADGTHAVVHTPYPDGGEARFFPGFNTQPQEINLPGEIFHECLTGFLRRSYVHDGAGNITSPADELNAVSCGYVAPPAPPVYGCTDRNASNYNEAATADDGSCVYTPAVPPSRFLVPKLNSLTFLQLETANTCSVFENADNTLFCQRTRPGIQVKRRYYQKVQRCDVLPLQVLTNYSAVSMTLRHHHTGATVLTVAAQQVLRLVGEADPVPVVLGATSDGWLKIQAPAGENLPPNVLRAPRVQLNDGTDTTTYRVVRTGIDSATGAYYLVLNRISTLALLGTATLQWTLVGPGYNVWEAALDFSTVPEGEYDVLIEATHPDYAPAQAQSEPLQVRTRHDITTLIEYCHSHNRFGMVWRTGLLSRVRVDSTFFRQQWGGTLSTHRNSNDTLTTVDSSAYRKQLLETIGLPDYLHEKLYLLFKLDFLRLNGLRYQTSEDYQPTEKRQPLGGGLIALEQRGWLAADQSADEDFGPSDDDNYLMAQDNYLLA